MSFIVVRFSSAISAIVYINSILDITASNIMLSIEDERILEEFGKQEQEHPGPRKVVDKDRTIYTSRKLSLPNDDLWV